jgi:vancomycin resistance protein VanJ
VVQSVWRVLALIGALYAGFLLALSVINAAAPQCNGLLALSQILALLLFMPLLLFVPLAFARVSPRLLGVRRALHIGLVACAVVAVVRFVPAWIPASPRLPAGGGLELGVTSWNMEGDATSPSAVVGALQRAPSGIVGLSELAEPTSAAIAADFGLLARFPYRTLSPRDDSLGIGLLSSYPFVGAPSVRLDPPLLQAQLVLGGGRSAVVVVTHPEPGHLRTVGAVPVDFDTSVRDAEIATIRSAIDPVLARGQPLLLLGDFNTTDREPIYRELSAGLMELQRSVGWGPGPTWRPDSVKWLPFGLLRIDMVFTGAGAAPLRVSPDCTPRGSDHCVVHAVVTLP